MTLKQFFQLAGGLVVGLIFYSSPLLGIIKWPLAIISGILGALLAFVPLEERPLEKWIFAFFKAIYAPTEFFWKRTVNPPKLFQDEPAEGASSTQTPAMAEYLNSTLQKSTPLGKLEAAEQGFFAKLTGIVSGMVGQTGGAAQAAPAAATAAVPGTGAPGLPTTTSPTTTGTTETQPKEMKIPETPLIKVAPAGPPHLVVEEKPRAPTSAPNIVSTHQVAPIIAGNEFVSTKQAIFSIDAAPPNPPTVPNVIVGQVVDQDRKIIEGAIMEIRDSAGRPIRALRSNKAGHFITVTSLDSGKYDIITEKDGFEFAPVSFVAEGNLIPPILVQGRKTTSYEAIPTQTFNQPAIQPANLS